MYVLHFSFSSPSLTHTYSSHNLPPALITSPLPPTNTCHRSVPTGGESEEEDAAGGHYEAIYEVISPAHEDDFARQDDNDFDDSFDSDDSENAYCRLRPQVRRSQRKYVESV